MRDPSLAYLKHIGFKHLRYPNEVFNLWVDLFGHGKAEKMYDQFVDVEPGTPALYDFKNSHPEVSLSISEAFDDDIIRKGCDFIAWNKDCFGKTILEIGCDIGLITGFLGLAFPDSKIVAIDRCASAIKIAEERMQKLGLTNVEFRHCALSDVKETFDTVFCMRTMQENLDKTKSPYEGEAFRYVCSEYSKATEEFTKLIKSCLKQDGTLCVFERVGHNPLQVAWLKDLSSQYLGFVDQTLREIECREDSETSPFLSFVCKNGTTSDVKLVFDNIYRSFQGFGKKQKEFYSWNAMVYLDEKAGRLIRGARIFSGDGKQIGRFAAFEDRDGKPLIHFLVSAGFENTMVRSESMDRKDQVLEELDNQISYNTIVMGFVSKDISPDDPNLEGNIKLFQ